VIRGKEVSQAWGELHERHDASDVGLKNQDRMIPPDRIDHHKLGASNRKKRRFTFAGLGI
jgi:hypothetical protein